jgi:flagellar basal body-associated protein FliL
MRRKEREKVKKIQTILLISILVIIVIALGIKTHYDYKNNWNFYDIAPAEENKVLIAQSDNIIPVSHTNENKQERFYVNLDKNDIDSGIFYEPKEKHIDKGFLLEQNSNGTFSYVY